MKKSNYFYYWANNSNSESGEGVLCRNFLDFLKKRYPKHYFINLNNFIPKENIFYNYSTPFVGVFKLWYFYLSGFKISYINYLPIWNFFIFLLLPQNTILGPITGTSTKKNFFYLLSKKISIYILRHKWEKLLFSNDQFKKDFKNISKKKFFNFLFYNYKSKLNIRKKNYDLIFYYRKNSNKGNNFYIPLLNKLSNKYKIAIIGDRMNLNSNIRNFKWVKRKKAIELIAQSKCGILSRENVFSYFALDCLSNNIPVFYNNNLKLEKNFQDKNFLIPIKYLDINYSFKIISNKLKNKKKINNFKLKLDNFDEYLA